MADITLYWQRIKINSHTEYSAKLPFIDHRYWRIYPCSVTHVGTCIDRGWHAERIDTKQDWRPREQSQALFSSVDAAKRAAKRDEAGIAAKRRISHARADA